MCLRASLRCYSWNRSFSSFFCKYFLFFVLKLVCFAFQAYCWVHGTFTLPSQVTSYRQAKLDVWLFQLTGKQGRDFAHPGVGPYPRLLRNSSRLFWWYSSFRGHDTDLVAVTEEGDEIRHAWYQWVVFVLFFQVPFYACFSGSFHITFPFRQFCATFLTLFGRIGRVGNLSYFSRCWPTQVWITIHISQVGLEWGLSVFQGLDQLSLEGAEGSQEKRRKIVSYVMSNLRRWRLNVVPDNLTLFLFSVTTSTSTSSSSASCWTWWTCLDKCGSWMSSLGASSHYMAWR